MIKKFISFVIAFLFSGFQLQAQDVEMADSMRQEGKIYVVISVIAVIFVSLVILLVMLDRKVRKLEEKLKEKE